MKTTCRARSLARSLAPAISTESRRAPPSRLNLFSLSAGAAAQGWERASAPATSRTPPGLPLSLSRAAASTLALLLLLLLQVDSRGPSARGRERNAYNPRALCILFAMSATAAADARRRLCVCVGACATLENSCFFVITREDEEWG